MSTPSLTSQSIQKQRPSKPLPSPPPKRKRETVPETKPQNVKQQDEEEEIDENYNPGLVLLKLQKAYDEGKTMKGIEWSDEEDECDELTDESLNESEDEDEDGDIDIDYDWNAQKKKIESKEEDAEQLQLAQYQKYVYKNDQPMMQMDKVRQVQSTRKAIDWDEDDFDTDSLSDQTEESDEETEVVQNKKVSTKKQYLRCRFKRGLMLT